MNVIIAGGSGTIGRALTEDLLKDGHRVWVLTRRPEGARLPRGAQAAGWDGASGAGWEGILAEADAVVNLAGENIGARPWTNERKRKIVESRDRAGRALVEALRAARNLHGAALRPRVLVQIAGIGYYGPRRDEIVTEAGAVGNDFLSRVAVAWEGSTRAVEELGIRRVVLRTAPVLADEGILDRMVLPVNLFAGGPLGSGRQWLSWVHMRDVVAAIRFAIDTETTAGVYNLSAPEPVTNATFIRTLASVMGRPYWLPVPAFALKALLGEMSTLVLDGQRVVPSRLQAEGFAFAYPELRPALEDLVG